MPILNPRVTTVGRLFFEDSVPEQHRLNILKDQPIETNAVKSILQNVAETDPDNYNKISYSLLSLGSKAALQTESSLTLDDFRSPIDKGSVINKVEQQERSIFARKDLTSDQKNVEMMKTYGKLSYDMPGLVFDSAMKNNNNLAKMVASGARGSKGQLNSNIGADWLVLDQNDNPIPIGIKHSYAEGLSPAEYFGSSYGTRSGLVSVKMATADSGFLSKQLAIAASNLIVTEKDCGTTRGIPVDADDKENIGTLLAKGSGGFGYNQILTAKDLKTFRDQKVGKIIVRSPMTCQAKSGLCSYCCGIREKGKLPSIMDNVGLGAGSAIGEPLCIAEGTLVRMGDFSTQKIENISIGDWVMGYDKDGMSLPVKVSAVFNNGPRECYKTTFRKGFGGKSEIESIICTLEHRALMVFPTTNNLNKVAEVSAIGNKPNSRRYLQLANTFDDSGLKNEPYALLCGLLIGDGSYAGASTQGVYFSCYDPLLIDDTKDYFKSLGVCAMPQSTPGEFRISAINYRVQIDLPDGTYVRNPVKEFLKNNEIWGQRSYEKTIPQCVSKWSNASVLNLISGLIATDGWICKSGANSITIGYGSTSHKLVQQLKELLELRFGIYASRITVKTKKKDDGGDYRPMFELSVGSYDDVKRLSTILNIPGVKKQRLSKLFASLTSPSGKKTTGRFKILSQESVGFCNTFDLEIELSTHLYVLANQVVVHNSQGALSAKHKGGVAGSQPVARVSGFKALNAILQSPAVYPDGAPVSPEDGVVTKVENAPQGGYNVYVNQEKVYAPFSQTLLVKPGSKLEAGDPLTDGVVSSSDVVRYKGIGAGRLHLMNSLRQSFKDGGMPDNRRNIEVISRAVINHVSYTDSDNDEYLPDEIVPYSNIESSYVPSPDTKTLAPKDSLSKYLQKPSLYYSVGTRITPSVSKVLEENGEDKIEVSDTKPGFDSMYLRLMEQGSAKEDLADQLSSSYVTRSLKDSVLGGKSTSDIHGNSPQMALAYGLEFGNPPKGKVSY